MIAALATPHIDWFALSAPLALLAAGAVNLLAAVFVPQRDRRVVAAIVCALGFAGALVAAAVLFEQSAGGHGVIADAIQRDRLGALATMVVAGAGILSIGVSFREPMADDHIAEYYALLAWAGAGMAFLATASTLLTLFLGLEWFSICLYILCAIDRELEGSLEAGLKYLIVGGFGSAMLLFGSALVYGATGRLEFHEIAQVVQQQGLSHDALLVTGLALVLGGLGFKASAAPFHMWTPDVYEGAPTPVTAFMSAATKTVALVLALRVLVTAFPQEARLWTVTVAAIACASLAVGNLAALVQRSVKRMLAYSSISHAGFMLIAVAANNALGGRALLYYLIPYSAMSVGAFAVVAARERELNRPVTFDSLAGLGWERPLLGMAMTAFMLGFAGLPLTGGFVGKFYIFAAAYRHGWTWLVIVGVAATAVSLYYYLGVIRAMYMRPAEELQLAPVAGGSPPRELALQTAVAAALAVTVGSFFAVQPLIDGAKHAASALPF
ncbi:MAG TPA: NADH-quinone oxidoreductase subunit N [Gaiellaceae bacterium]|nr:NADH-quinone oxidoreductase subunit N [Gaiellaceae bacterium]